jgi:hypothetical protein
MVFFNYATMQMAAKIVYYGPGLCGKTTNLHHIYTKTSPQSRGEMVSLETETDRTLFFDLLPIDVGIIGGFKTRLQLYTVPGQVFYNQTRKLVLKGADGIVFVADSQTAMLEANVESYKNLRENLAEIGLNLDELPLVIQLNKRDLPNIADGTTILRAIDGKRQLDSVEASAATGTGVFETLKLISKLTLRTLRVRMAGDAGARGAAPARKSGVFTVQDVAGARRPAAEGLEAPAEAPVAPVVPAVPAAPSRVEPPLPMHTIPGTTELPPDYAALAGLDADAILGPPPAEVSQQVAAIEVPVADPDIDFSQTEKPSRKAPDVRHVKVRSSVDIMAELESLRKKATQAAPAPKERKGSASILDALNSFRPKREIIRNVGISVPAGAIARTRRVRVTVVLEDASSDVVQREERTIELESVADAQSLLLNLKLDPDSGASR